MERGIAPHPRPFSSMGRKGLNTGAENFLAGLEFFMAQWFEFYKRRRKKSHGWESAPRGDYEGRLLL